MHIHGALLDVSITSPDTVEQLTADGILAITWMSTPAQPSFTWQIFSYDFEPFSSFFAVKKACEPVHIQMNEPDCRIIVINHQADALVDVTATATIYNLSGHKEQKQKKKFTATADAGTDVFTLDWPATGAHLGRKVEKS